MTETMVITVPAGDVEALYDAVYERNGQPRDNVEINLEAGVFTLDPIKPFGGRLILGDNTTLRSSLEMAVDANDLPLVDTKNEPMVLVDGARIDGSKVVSTFVGMAIIEIGDQGLVEQLWVDGGDPFADLTSGLEITARGTVRAVYSTGHFTGARVRAKDAKAKGAVEGNLFAGNAIGLSIIGIESTTSHPTGSNVEVRATLCHNVLMNNIVYNLNITGGFGSDNNVVAVKAFHNIFRGGTSQPNIRAMSGTNFFSFGSKNNKLKLTLMDNLIADTVIGLEISSGHLLTSDSAIALAERYSSNNQTEVRIADTTFENNTTDIVVYGSHVNTSELGGGNNDVKVEIEGNDQAALTIEVLDYSPEAAFPVCASKAKAKFN